jgi:hypothetical protein
LPRLKKPPVAMAGLLPTDGMCRKVGEEIEGDVERRMAFNQSRRSREQKKNKEDK